MFKNLLVPLDGSRLAESVLPTVASLAQKTGASVTLMHAVEYNAPHEIHGERHMTTSEEACTYLNDITHRAVLSQVHVTCHVHTSEISDVARCIEDHTRELGADLIIMCTHGYSGLRSWIFGSIAQQVITLGSTPVLLIQPSLSPDEEISCSYQRLLVPLDGHPDHEQGLNMAVDLAKTYAANVHILVVVRTLRTLIGERAATATLLPGATSKLLDLIEDGARDYLLRHLSYLKPRGISVTTEVQRGDPITTIVQIAEQRQTDLIVIGTHGKSSMDSFWSGSITPRIINQSRLPLLLVPIK